MPNLSPALRNFYLLYLEWAWHGAPDTRIFRKSEGLCGNMFEYFHGGIISFKEYASIIHEQRMLFRLNGLHNPFPFGESDFSRRRYYQTLHQCPLRLSWVAYCLNLIPSPNGALDHSAFHLPYSHPPGALLPPPYFPIPDLPAQFFASDGSRKVLADSLVPSDHPRRELPAYGPRDYLLDDSPAPRKPAAP